MTIEQTIVRELSAAMQAERFLYPRDHSLIHASAIGQCRRQQGYELMGVEGLSQDSHFLSICDIGHGVHHQIQSRLVNVLGWCKQENIELEVRNDEYGIIGHIDALSDPLGMQSYKCMSSEVWGARLEKVLTGDRYIIDIKTITSRPYVKAEPDTGNIHHIEPSSFEKLTKPKKEHLLQVNLYAWMAKEMGLVDELPRIMVIYVGKDVEPPRDPSLPDRLLNLPYKVFAEDASEEQIETALKRAKHIWSRVRKGELPGKDHWWKPEAPAWQCGVCSFRKTCYQEEGYFAEESPLISPSSLAIVESYRRA
jgi:hypothetical protein